MKRKKKRSHSYKYFNRLEKNIMILKIKQKGFTLIEIIVATTIFSLLMSIGVASYLNISTNLKKQNLQRKLYTEVSQVLSDIHQLGKFFTIDYDWYKNNSSIDISEGNEELVLINKEKNERIHITKIEREVEEKQLTSIGMYKEFKDDYNTFVPEEGFESEEFQPLNSHQVIVEQLRFFISPKSKDGDFHPKTTIVIKGKIISPFSKHDESFLLQTTFSPRSYLEIL